MGSLQFFDITNNAAANIPLSIYIYIYIYTYIYKYKYIHVYVYISPHFPKHFVEVKIAKFSCVCVCSFMSDSL